MSAEQSSSQVRRPGRLRAALVFGALLAITAPARASDLTIDGCECLLVPGQTVSVTVDYSNTTANPALLFIELTLPNEKKLYLSPVGLVERPSPWLTVPANSDDDPVDVLNQLLTPQSLPFGNWPLVPPFHYQVAASLVSSTTGAPIAPFVATSFDFEPFAASPPPTDPGTLHIFTHQHMDPAWLIREEVAFPAAAEWIAESIALAQSDPTYRFVIDQPLVLQSFEQIHPELKSALQQLIDQGRVEVAGGFYILNDLNLVSGESMVRQILYGQRYLEERWGRRARIAWNLDQFGHPHQMPQFAVKGGMNYYAFTRGIPGLDSLGLPGSEFYWRSPDGSTVLANNIGNGYQLGRSIGDVSPDDQEITEVFRRVQPSSITGNFLTGDGADVSEQVLNDYQLNVLLPDAIENWNPQQVAGVETRISTPSEFFTAIETSGVELPTIGPVEFQTDGEPDDPRIFPGSYASRSGVKQTNQRLEHLQTDTEKLATLAWIEGASYPAAPLEDHAKNIARNQTHDYLPGTGVDAIYADPDATANDFGDRAALTQNALLVLRDDATEHIASRVDTQLAGQTVQHAWVVFNTQAWQRRDLARVANPSVTSPAKLVDASGAEVAYQITTEVDGTHDLLFVADVPATGYATYFLVAGTPAKSPTEVTSGIPATGVAMNVGPHFRFNVDRNAYVRGLISNSSGETLIAAPQEPPDMDDLGGLLWWADESYGNSYDYGPPLVTGSQAGAPATSYAFTGPVVTRFVSTGPVANTSIAIRETVAIPALGRIDFDTRVVWSDANKNLYVRFPFRPQVGASITNGVPFGAITRGSGHQPVLYWADWGTPNQGVSVLNQAIFDHQFSLVPSSITPGTTTPQMLDMTLLRSMPRAVFGDYPSEQMKELGAHQYQYALLPHHGGWREAQTPRRAFEFGSPLLPVEASIQAGTLPRQRSYLALNEGSDAIVSAFYRDGDDVIVRLYDTTGRVTSQTLTFPFLDATTIDETNFLGDFEDVLGSGSKVDVPTVPEEIVTVRLNTPDVVAPEVPPTDTNFQRSIDLASTDTPRLSGVDSADLAGRAVSSIGDIDGDGYDDILIGANQGDGPNNAGQSGAGEVYVVLGGPRSKFGAGFKLSQADMTLYGLRAGTFAGTRVTSGDFDCDGFSDIVVGSVGNPTGEESRNASGVTWVYFGRARELLASGVDLANDADLEIWGNPGDIAGEHVAAGDLDGNGCDDLLIGAPSADGKSNASESAGEAYILFGDTRAKFVQTGIRVLGIHSDAVIYGATAFDHFGWAIETGDVDADGYDDAVISAIDADGSTDTKQAAGDVFVFWGGPRATMQGVEFFASMRDNMTAFYGVDSGDLAGFNFGVGDVDADGFDDVLVGVPYSDGLNNGVGDVTGEAYLIFGKPRAQFAASNELAVAADVAIFGSLPDDATGHTVIISDLSGDGRGDLVIGAPVANGFQGQRPESGAVHVLLGRPQAEWPAQIVLGNQTSNYVIRGSKAFESSGFGLSAGDLDGDGRDDLVIGSPFYSGTGAGTDRIGATWLLFSDSFDRATKDQVKIERAEWNPATGVLQIDATTSAGAAAYRLEDEVFVRESGVTTQLTADSNDALQLSMRGGAAVWSRFDGADDDIFFWNGAGVLQLTSNDSSDSAPRTDGTNVVWMGAVGADQEIFLWNGTTVQQLTDNTTDDLFPDVANGEVVWMGYDGTDFEIYRWSAGVTTALTNNATRDQDPRIDAAGAVAWSGFDGSDYEIYLADGGAPVALTNDALDDATPVIDDGQVAWLVVDGTEFDVRLFDGAQTHVLSSNAVADGGIALSQGRVAWSSGDGNAAEIYLYDPIAGLPAQRITNDFAPDVAPALDGATLVWEKRAAGTQTDSEIWSWDGVTATALTSDVLDQGTPAASGARVAWLGAEVDSTLRVAGIGDLTFDPATGLYSATFTMASPPNAITVESPFGGAVTVEVATLPGVDAEVAAATEAVTDNGDDLTDEDPQIWGNQVVWAGYDGNDYEIYLYDGTQVVPLTDNETDDTQPRIHSGKVTWEGEGDADGEIYFWDGAKTTRLTNNARVDRAPRIHGSDVVWEEVIGTTSEIFLYHAGARTQVTRNDRDDVTPEVEDGTVVWAGFDGNDWEIYRWSRGQRTQITNNQRDDVDPKLSNGAIVWRRFDDTDWEVHRWANGVATQITNNPTDATNLAFRDGVAVWQENVGGGDTEILSWTNGVLKHVTSNDQDDRRPSTDQGLVVWQGGVAGAYEIYVYNPASGLTTRLTTNTIADEQPQVQGGRVVWQAPNGSAQNLDVFLWDGTAVRNLSAAGDGASDQKPSIGAGGRIAWQGFDGDPEIDVVSGGGSTLQLTHNRFEEFLPRVDPVTGWVIWHGLDDVRIRVDNPGQGEGGTGATVVGGDFEIYLWNGATVQRLTTRDKLDDFYPSIHDGKAVWLGGDGTDVEVFFWNGTTTTKLTANNFDESNARTNGGRAVWQGWDGHDMEIFYWNGSAIAQLTNNDGNDVAPEIAGNLVAWSGQDGGDFDIFVYDTVSTLTAQLTTSGGDDTGAQVANGLVVWQGWDGDDFEIYQWNGSVTTKLTNNTLRDERPRVDALGNVVWQTLDGFDLEVFFWDGVAVRRATDNVADDANPEIHAGTIVWQAYDGRDFEIQKLQIP